MLRFKQGKTGQLLEILIEGEIARVIDTHPSNIATYVHNREGRPYTVMGLGVMFRRCCGPGKDESDPRLAVADFGLRDGLCPSSCAIWVSTTWLMSVRFQCRAGRSPKGC